jgi:autotransporter-associated beta strand protein
MKTTSSPCRTLASFCKLVPVSLAAWTIMEVNAADRTWTGGGADDNWSTPANWGGSAPVPGDSLFFGGNVRTSPNNNFPAGTPFSGLTINNPASPFTLRGLGLTLAGNLVDNMPLVPQTNNLPLTLNATRSVNVVADGLLTLGGAIAGPGFGLTKTGDGQLTLGAVNSFSGPVTINAGTVSVAADNNLGAAPGAASPGRIAITAGTLRTTVGFTLNANRGLALGPAGGSGAGTNRVDSGTTLTYGGVLANNTGGTGGLSKIGFGGLTLFGANTYTGPTIILNGTLTLDFTQAGAPVNNIIASSSALTLGGANAGLGAASFDALTMNGRVSTTDSQTFNGTTIDIGPAILRVNSGGGGAANLILGALAHNPGGILNLITPASTGGGGDISTTTANTHGILGGWATVGNGGNFNNITMGTEWASVDGSGRIVAYSGHRVFQTGENLHSIATPATNLRINASSVGDATVNLPNAGTVTDLNTINVSETRAMSIVIGTGNTLRLGRFGSIFKSDNANNITWVVGTSANGANGIQDDGVLTAGGAADTAGEIVFYMNNGSSQSQGSLNVEALVTDNGSGALTVVKAGPGSMKFRGHNTYSGGTYLLQGRFQLAGSEIGTPNPGGWGAGPVYVMPGAYAFPSGVGDFGVTGVAIANRFFIAGLGTQQEQVGAIRFGNGTRIAGDVTLTGDSRLGGGNATTLPNTGISGKIGGPFHLDIGALQTINTFISLFNPANDWTGNTTFNARNTATANSVRNGASEVIPNGVGKGNVTLNGNTSTGTITWDLNGFNETINGLLSAGNLAGCIILNNAASTTSTLTVGDYDQTATFGGSIQNGAGGSGIVALTKIGGGRQTLTGVNTYTGPTTVKGGALAAPLAPAAGGNGTLALSGAGSIAASQQIIVDGATLDVSEVTGGFTHTSPIDVTNGTLTVRSTVAPGLSSLSLVESTLRLTTLGSSPTAVEVTALTTGGQTNFIDVASVGAIAGYPARFTILKYTGAIGGAGFNFGLGKVPTPSTVGYVSNNVDNSSVDLVLLDGPKPLTWTGVKGPAWDIATTSNWLAFGTTPAAYLDIDSVRFDDSASLGMVNLTTVLEPGSIVVSNPGVTFKFTGPGKLTGATGLTKEGGAPLILDNSGTNDFFGPITINAGDLQVGDSDTKGNLGIGAIINNATIEFRRADNHTVGNAISGPGSITQNGSGVLTLSGNSTFTGPVAVNLGTLRAASTTALGTADGDTTVGGGTLDVNGQNLTPEPVTVSGVGADGTGAIVNHGPEQLNALRTVTLAGDTTFGGSARWDIRNAGGNASLNALNGGLKITKVGPNQVSLVGVTAIDPLLGDIDVQQGIFAVQTTTAQLGDMLASLTVHANATLNLFNLNANPVNKDIHLNDGAIVWNENGRSVISGPISLLGKATFNVALAGATPSLTLNNIVNGPGSLIKIGPGPLVLVGPSEYLGATTISNGTLFQDGFYADVGTFTAYGGTLGGVGTINGNAVITAQGTLAPGSLANPIGVLSINGALSLGGTNVMDADKAGGTFVNDGLFVGGTLSYGGTLQLNLTGEALAENDALFLYSLATANGAFARIIPAAPGAGLAWDTRQLTVDGSLRVTAQPTPGIASVFRSGTDLILCGTNGPPGGTYHVLCSTNVVLPLTSWTPMATNLFDASGNFKYTNAIDPTSPERFFTLRLP